MDTQEKLDILSADAQYDLSCACGTKNPLEHRKRNATGDGWLYPMSTASGGSGIILKTLLGNRCANDCKYCPLRAQQDFHPVALSPYEMASFFFEFQLKRPLIGIFLSSAVMGNADKTMDMLVATAEILRKHYRYKGYIHLKIIPGASRASIDAALCYASAVSLNIEAPGVKHFSKLTDRKDYQKDIIDPLVYIGKQTSKNGRYKRVHTSSQFIVGASDEVDKEILFYGSRMYSELNMGRLYFSAYQSGLGDPSIPGEQRRETLVQQPWVQPSLFGEELQVTNEVAKESLIREHRLYQADWLLRKYSFSYEDLIFEKSGNLSMEKDPKLVWAEHHQDYFPISVKQGTKEQLLRVPGIGPAFADRIVAGRKHAVLSNLEDLHLPSHCLQKAEGYLHI
ncbi:radical SAM protein [uncultured Sphaerochaeta sp.]|uniref:radical SAM protein n=1 Tax=uncultured Sphaerochaeta sp. TaxID=886478 RepID=UPI002A0A681A|nr:radical SAM protein [uncultured Sphaerochaeta sp.]